jgi:hypothetical protein
MLSWALSTIALITKGALTSWNTEHFLGVGVLWLSLALLDCSACRRARRYSCASMPFQPKAG